MSVQSDTSFTRYIFTKEESLQASQLTTLQKQHIQNLLADVAEEKINLTFDPLNPVAFAQQEADLTGKITILKYILELAEAPPEATE